MRTFSRAALLLVSITAALVLSGTASAATGYHFFGTGQYVTPGESSSQAAEATTDGSTGTTFGGVAFDVPAGLTVADLDTLATNYQFTSGDCGSGTPRFSVGVSNGTTKGNLFFYLGTPPNYTGCSTTWAPTGNLAAPTNTVDATQLGGSPYEPYSLVQSTYGDYSVDTISLVVDASGPAQTVQFDNTQINDTTITYEPECTATGFVRDGIDLTAAQIGGDVTGTVNATGCNIGVYNPDTVSDAEIYGANYFGVVANGVAADVTGSTIHDIGEVPPNGSQHGVGIYYSGASGTIDGNTVSNYQKGGIVVTNDSSATVTKNTVTGLGPVDFIAQNGIQISYGATALLTGNDVSLNNYTPDKVTSCGLLIYKAGGVGASKNGLGFVKSDNDFHDNETDICNFGKGGGFDPS